jgi:hypothetical protein
VPVLESCHKWCGSLIKFSLLGYSGWRMGMITRVRARLQSINTPTKIDPRIQDEKTAQTGENTVSATVRYRNHSSPFGTTLRQSASTASLLYVWSVQTINITLLGSSFKGIMNDPHVTCVFLLGTIVHSTQKADYSGAHHFNIIFPSMPISPKWTILSWF